MLAALALFVGSLMLVPLLPQRFVPAADRGQTQGNVELPPGSTLTQTRDMAEQVRQAILADDETRTVVTAVGAGASGGNRISATGVPRSAARYAHRCDHAAA